MGEYDINNMQSSTLFQDMSAHFEQRREQRRLAIEKLKAF